MPHPNLTLRVTRRTMTRRRRRQRRLDRLGYLIMTVSVALFALYLVSTL